VASITFDDLGVPAFVVNSASVAGFWTGARSFAEGFRSFEVAMEQARRSGGDVIAALHDVQGQDALAGQPRPARLRRVRRAAGGLLLTMGTMLLRSRLR
jgi:hypothetical protein